jgi:hypothetical protein
MNFSFVSRPVPALRGCAPSPLQIQIAGAFVPKNVNRVALALLASAILAGCASTGDWKYSEIVLAIDNFRSEQPSTAGKLPPKIRSIYVDGTDALRVYLTNDSGFRGQGYELKLKRTPAGSWVVVASRAFGL